MGLKIITRKEAAQLGRVRLGRCSRCTMLFCWLPRVHGPKLGDACPDGCGGTLARTGWGKSRAELVQ